MKHNSSNAETQKHDEKHIKTIRKLNNNAQQIKQCKHQLKNTIKHKETTIQTLKTHDEKHKKQSRNQNHNQNHFLFSLYFQSFKSTTPPKK